MTPNVLFVDDEPNVLKAVKRCLRDLDINLQVAESGLQGLAIMAATPMQVVVSDMRMPHMGGIDFLQKARTLQPHAIYMVLSGHADLTSVLAAINTSHVWRFITKPWQEAELQLAVNNALELVAAKAAERRLKRQLVKSNQKLVALSKSLERKVAQRTQTLHARNEILQMMVADLDFAKIIVRICVEMARELDIQRLFVDVCFMDAVFSDNGPCRLTGDLARLARTARQTGTRIEDAHGYAIPLVRDDQMLGICLADNPLVCTQQAKGWLALLTLCLMHARSMQDAPELVETIDRLLDGL